MQVFLCSKSFQVFLPCSLLYFSNSVMCIQLYGLLMAGGFEYIIVTAFLLEYSDAMLAVVSWVWYFSSITVVKVRRCRTFAQCCNCQQWRCGVSVVSTTRTFWWQKSYRSEWCKTSWHCRRWHGVRVLGPKSTVISILCGNGQDIWACECRHR